MEAILGAIFELVLTFVIEIVAEVIGELGFHSLAAVLERSGKSRILVGFGYSILGGILGGLSVLIVPEPMLRSGAVKILYFALSPILLGFSLCVISWLIDGRRYPILSLEKFLFGAVFALAYSGARLFFLG